MTEPRPESPGGQAEQHAAPTPEITIDWVQTARLNASEMDKGHIDSEPEDAVLLRGLADEIDRLAAVNDRLVTALKTLRPMVGAPHDYTIADVWKAQKLADAVLGEARKS